MKISSINKIEEFITNHERWHICDKCQHEYDLNNGYKCPHCGSYYYKK